jgi:23S rRNA pseudouridine955/2504/2580 synthase
VSGVENRLVAREDDGIRLDRWFRRHFPQIGHGRVEKLLRTGQVRVDGARAKGSTRLAAGQTVRVPPLPREAEVRVEAAGPPPRPVSAAEAADLRGRVLHRDPSVIVINKPAGLATQGGTGLMRHLDAMLDALRFDAAERPRLVHRLDKDTSGVLLLARSAAAANKLTAAFRHKSAHKLYWALTAGVPHPAAGRVDLALAKAGGAGAERMVADEEEGKRAVTLYRVLETVGKRAAWLALMPLTGRTHQLRAHCAALGTPIVGDGKYGGAKALLQGVVSRKLHLHARSIELPHPDGGVLKVTAPLPPHMLETWRLFGFDPEDRRDPFAEAAVPARAGRRQPRPR